jgi:hypothetical protein
MSKLQSPAEAKEDELPLDRKVTVVRYHGREPVIVRTARLPGEEPSREERVRAGLRRLAADGRIITLAS